MKLSPIKKFVISIAAASVVLTLLSQFMISNFMDIKIKNAYAQREAAYAQQIKDAYNSGSGNGGSNNGGNGGFNNGGSVAQPSGSDNGSSQNSQQGAQTPGSDDKTPGTDNGGNAGDNAGVTQGDGLKMYVDALNKAKTSATKVTRVRTNASNYKDHVKAGMLSSIAKSLMGTFMKEDTTPVDIDKNDLPPKGAKCTLSQDAVQSVDVKKDGDNTIVTIVTKAESNPKAGSGIGTAVSIIEDKTITDAVAGVIEISDIKLDYDPCTLKATIDANGNLVALYVQAPCILSLSAMGIDAEVGIDCEDEFVIAY